MEAHKFNRLLSRISCDKEAFELLYGEYYLKMKLHIRRRWGNLVAAEDIVQDVFVKLMERKPKEYVSYPTSWLYRMADNYVKDILRSSHTAESAITETSESFDLDAVIINADVREALRTLDETSQKIIYMNIWEGLTFKEIADEMSVSYGSVRTKASRAYKKLRPII